MWIRNPFPQDFDGDIHAVFLHDELCLAALRMNNGKFEVVSQDGDELMPHPEHYFGQKFSATLRGDIFEITAGKASGFGVCRDTRVLALLQQGFRLKIHKKAHVPFHYLTDTEMQNFDCAHLFEPSFVITSYKGAQRVDVCFAELIDQRCHSN